MHVSGSDLDQIYLFFEDIQIFCGHQFCNDRKSYFFLDGKIVELGAGITGPNLAKRMVEVFLNTEFEGGRHARRVAQLDAIRP